MDNVSINFNPESLLILNIILALLMLGVSLSLKVDDFTRVLKKPLAPAIGLLCQFIILPAFTYALTQLLDMAPSIALGMILVSSCPGGVFSNVITFIGKGNVATSVSMTAISSLSAVIMTPFNLTFYASLDPQTSEILSDVGISFSDVFTLIIMVLGLPLATGMYVGHRFPAIERASVKPLRKLSLIVFIGFVFIAFINNANLFAEYWPVFLWLVILHNGCALLLGNLSARLFKLQPDDRRAITFEVGIQNSGLGLVLLFTFMPNIGGAMMITAFWGVWHLVTGSTLAFIWSRKAPDSTQ
ncbi:bile acid:sodium symporter family protein [Alteromonadaceae bacterium M269]|nr:bile acid:sodium symporter family protein [Alteromonadaceae bacterium M269]